MHDLRILVIDPDNSTHATLIDLLASEGAEVAAVHDGSMALQVARQTPPDAILLDLGLPAANGYRTLERLLEARETHGTPVIVMTAREDARADEAFQRGAAGFLHKPFQGNELKALLRSVVEPEAKAA